ncbi:hypothetical protein QR98_0022590 [Sarcoptes scabiei]|uniref:Pre-mRNA-splicing regulator WTAP-like protein n=1 Tax=Sarcoptes scabiei TaxID=52283 RepID=A0A131ZYR0_SARSC|nr:hypothetical protein QR98_0022590 [Sarcoptes scabiei]
MSIAKELIDLNDRNELSKTSDQPMIEIDENSRAQKDDLNQNNTNDAIHYEYIDLNKEVTTDNRDEKDAILKDENDLDLLSDEELRKISKKMFVKLKELRNQKNQAMIDPKQIEVVQNHYERELKRTRLEAIRKENVLMMRLTLKEQELQDCLSQIKRLELFKYKANQPEFMLQDPALNYIFQKMDKEVENAKSRVEEMQKEMNAWKFSHDSMIGKQLMSKCKMLHQENEDLGKMISSGKIAKLESGLAMYKKYSETLAKSQQEFEETLNEIEENGEGLQNTIYYLNSKCQELKDKIQKLQDFLQNCEFDEKEALTKILSE